GRTRSSAIPLRRDTLFDRRSCAVSVDGFQRGAISHRESVDLYPFSRIVDFRLRLRTAVLGRAACAIRNCRSHDGDDPGLHGAVRDSLPAHAAADDPPRPGTVHWNLRRGSPDESLAQAW